MGRANCEVAKWSEGINGKQIPYSGKFSRVQNFVELPLRAPEEIFAVLIFAAPVRTGRRGAIDIALGGNFHGSYFRASRPIRENREILHHVKISRYTVVK